MCLIAQFKDLFAAILWHGEIVCNGFPAATDEVKLLIRPIAVDRPSGLAFQDSSDSDTSSESDIAEITDIRQMREIISRMDDDDDGGDHDKCDSICSFKIILIFAA